MLTDLMAQVQKRPKNAVVTPCREQPSQPGAVGYLLLKHRSGPIDEGAPRASRRMLQISQQHVVQREENRGAVVPANEPSGHEAFATPGGAANVGFVTYGRLIAEDVSESTTSR